MAALLDSDINACVYLHIIDPRYRGMAPDAVDEDDMEEAAMMDGSGARRQVDPDASYRKDPKKALRHYLESKGYSCEFEIEESGPGHAREYTARIRLPIETSMGPVYGEATTGKRKDAEREAALDACIQLDSRGMLNNNKKGSSEGKKCRSLGSEWLLDGFDMYAHESIILTFCRSS